MNYKILNKQVFSKGNFSLVPIRFEDRYNIMRWRNEQIYHLRQNQPLTKEDQDDYFENVVNRLFEQVQPNQILFSYLENEICIGYGGLVHINWIDKNAEISLVLNTKFEKKMVQTHWRTYLDLLEEVANFELKLHKIYTYAFDLRPYLYDALENSGFYREANLKNHCYYNGKFVDVVIHSKILEKFYNRKAEFSDIKLLFDWANEPSVRENSLSTHKINWEQHLNWFYNKYLSNHTIMMIWIFDEKPVGQSRLDYDEGQGHWIIDYSIDIQYRGKGFGTKIIKEIMKNQSFIPLKAQVKPSNIGSTRVFEKLGFSQKIIINKNTELIEFCYK